MKRCVNTDCTSYQENRAFPDADIICPRCGEPLQISDAQIDPNLYPGVNPYGVAGWQLPKRDDNLYAGLGAAATIALVLFIIWALLQMGAIAPGASAARTTPTTISYAVAPAVQTQRAAEAVRTTRPTPIGGLISGIDLQALPSATPIPLPTTAVIQGSGPQTGGGGNTGGNSSGSDGIRTLLCRRIDAGQACDPVTSYGTSDGFYLAVESDFGSGAATSMRVRWFGPPNGEQQLVGEDQVVTPDRSGRFWVGFTLTPNQPWTPGIYRADIYFDNSSERAAYSQWNVGD